MCHNCIGVSASESSSLPPGISFKFVYEAVSHPFASFFSEFFVQHESSGGCAIDGFMSLDNILNINSLSLTSDCLGLKIGNIVLPNAFRHIIYFPGLIRPPFTHSETTILVYSKLKSSRAVIGDFFELVSDDRDLTVLEIAVSSKTSQLNGVLKNVSISIFDSQMSAEVTIKDPWLSFKGSTTIFHDYEITCYGTSSTDVNAGSMSINLNAEITDGAVGFKTNIAEYLNSHIREETDNVLKRRENAQKGIMMLETRRKELLTQLEEKKKERTDLQQQYKLANVTLTYWKEKIEETKNNFEERAEEYENQESKSLSLDSICIETECEYLCDHSNVSCSACYSNSRIEESGICEMTVSNYQTVVQYRQVAITSWRYELRCRSCWTIRWFSLFFVTYGDCCTTEYVPFTDYHKEPYYSEEPYTQIVRETCTTNVYEESVSGQCCMERPCVERVQDLSCLINNMECQKERQTALANIESTLSLLYQTYSEAKMNFTISEVEMTRINANLHAVEQEYKLINNAIQTTQLNLNIRKKAKEIILQETEIFNPILTTMTNLVDSEEIVQVKNVTFDIVLNTSTPISFPVSFTYVHASQSYELSVIIDFAKPREYIYRRVSEEISKDILRNYASLRKRQAIEFTDKYTEFSATCVYITNIESYIQQISVSLNESLQQLLTSQYIVSSNRVNDTKLISNEQKNLSSISMLLDSYLYFTNDKDSSITKVVNTLQANSFPQWQTNMELVHRNGSNVAGLACGSFTDCLQSAFESVTSFIEDTTLQQARHLEQKLKAIKEDYFGIGYNHNYTFDEAQTILSQFMQIVADLKELEYWCSEPPQIIEQPPAEVNVSIGDTLELSCKAFSSLPVQYHWMRDSVLLSSSSNTLSVKNIQISEDGNYFCFVTSDAGIATSLSTIVNIYYQPILNLSLAKSVETYEGNDNGVTLVCDAHSWPPLGWKWFYRATNIENWNEIAGIDSNVLFVENPKLSDEGWYTCMAYNWIGNVSSQPSYLTVLPASLARIEYPISIDFAPEFNVTLASNIDLNRAEYKQVVYTTVHNSLQLTSTQIKDIQLISDNGGGAIISFKFITPYFVYNSSENIQNVLIDNVEPSLLQLEQDKNNLIALVSQDSGFVINVYGLSFRYVENSLDISPRVFVCPMGYQVDSSLVICG